MFWYNISNTGQMVNHRQPPFHHVPMHSLSHHPSLLLSINSFLNSSSFLFFLKIILIWNYDDDLWGWTETWLRYTSCNFCLKSLLVLNLEINAPYGSQNLDDRRSVDRIGNEKKCSSSDLILLPGPRMPSFSFLFRSFRPLPSLSKLQKAPSE